MRKSVCSCIFVEVACFSFVCCSCSHSFSFPNLIPILIQPNLNTRKLVVEAGFKYDSDSYADDLPYWTLEYGEFPHLIIPYTLSENDMKFTAPNSFSHGGDFCKYLKDHLRYLMEEGRAGYPKIMSVGLHCRLARPGRVAGLAEFLDFVKSYGKDVWVCTREEIADFWKEEHFPKGVGSPIKPPTEATVEDGEAKSSDADGEVVDDGYGTDEDIVAEPLDADGVNNNAPEVDESEEGDVI